MRVTPEALAHCAQERIEIPECIQPFGALVVCDPASGRIVRHSAGAAALLASAWGTPSPPGAASTGIGGKFELRPPIAEGHDIRIGADYRRADGELQEEALSAISGAITERRRAGGATANLGIFVEDDWQIGPLTLNGGLRAEHDARPRAARQGAVPQVHQQGCLRGCGRHRGG